MVRKSEVGQFLGVCVLELGNRKSVNFWVSAFWSFLRSGANLIEEFGVGQILGVWKVLQILGVWKVLL